MTTQTKTLSDIYEAAARILETEGWCRKATCDKSGRLDIEGALNAAATDYYAGRSSMANEIIYEPARQELGVRALYEWNDAQSDKRKVIRLLRRISKGLAALDESNAS